MPHPSQFLSTEELARQHKAMAAQSFQHKFNVYLFVRTRELEQDLINGEDFLAYELNEADVQAYTQQYWQKEAEEMLGSLRVREIEEQMQAFLKEERATVQGLLVRYVSEQYDALFPLARFRGLLQADQCYYCGLSLDEIEQLYAQAQLRKKSGRGFRLEVSLKDPNLEYSQENCVAACYWCNTAKGDEFSAEEFRDFAPMLRKTLLKRLA